MDAPVSSQAILKPVLSQKGLVSTHEVASANQHGTSTRTILAGELPLTVWVDGHELVTLMTLGLHPEKLVLGYLRNQTLFDELTQIRSIEVDWERGAANVETVSGKGFDGIDVSRRTVTTGCGQGTILSCTLDKLYDHRVAKTIFRQSEIYDVLRAMKTFNQTYRIAGSLHGCGLYQKGEVICFIEDVGRHNAMDAIAGEMWLRDIDGKDAFLYTTGRLTSEIVMKSALMGIPVLISRNGTTYMGQELAEELGVALVARAKSRQFVAFNAEMLVFDALPVDS